MIEFLQDVSNFEVILIPFSIIYTFNKDLDMNEFLKSLEMVKNLVNLVI
jgi:hypothetical protein